MDEFIVVAFLASELGGFDRPEPTPVFGFFLVWLCAILKDTRTKGRPAILL
jgi:hypothetical protein